MRGDSHVYVGTMNYPPQFIMDYTAPSGIYNHMAYDYGYYCNTTWAVRSNGGITAIQIVRGGEVRRISSEIPSSYTLEQNFPNPFNPSTNIRFSIPEGRGGFITLKIYDILGCEVATLVNQQLEPCTYETTFDATKISSGIYYYRLEAGVYSQVKKMVVLK